MVSGRAQRPGDIVTSLSGKTVEVLNTDAEGRLILIDAITYAIRLRMHAPGGRGDSDRRDCRGARVIFMSAHSRTTRSFSARVMAAGKSGGERMWHMPLDDDYKEYLKSRIRRSAEHRRALGWRNYRREVPRGVRRGEALGAPGYRGDGLARRSEAVSGERPVGRAGADVRQSRDELVKIAKSFGYVETLTEKRVSGMAAPSRYRLIPVPLDGVSRRDPSAE